MPLASYKEVLLPRLHQDEYRITSPESDRYNCIAWAAGDATRRWWPGEPDYYWPPDAPQGETLESFQAVFAALGYRECAGDELEPGYEKVAIFAKDGWPTHAARQLPNGHWSSKLGRWEDIEHHTLQALVSSLYGGVACLLRRPC